jgi:hypothetical protein
LATYIVSNNTELFRGPSGWEDQLNLSDISQTNNARSGFLGIIDKDGGDGGLTGEKIKSEIETLINEGKINRSLISFIAWTMKDRPNMWKNLPLWSYFISMNGSFSLNQMNVDILSQIKTHLDNSINNPTATKPTGYKFRTWAALNTWSENPVSGVFPVADDSCVSGNGVDQPLTSKLECFGRRDGAGSTNIALGELPSHAQTRLSDKTWSLPPDSELNRDLTAGNGDLPLSKFEQRTKDQIIGSASTITGVKYSDKEAFLKTPVGGIQKPNNAFVTLLDDKFINYLQDVIRNFRNVIDNVGGQTQSLGAIYNSFLNGSSPAWVDFWQVMLVMQENIERRAYVLNFVVAATDEELDQRAIDIENGTRDALLGRQGQPPPEPDPQETEEKIKGRQKFFKQCALLLNALGLKENYNQELINRCTRTDVNEGPINNGSVFDERLFMLEGDSHQDNSLSFLQLDPILNAVFNDLPPRVFSYIKPKIKLFRIRFTSPSFFLHKAKNKTF